MKKYTIILVSSIFSILLVGQSTIDSRKKISIKTKLAEGTDIQIINWEVLNEIKSSKIIQVLSVDVEESDLSIAFSLKGLSQNESCEIDISITEVKTNQVIPLNSKRVKGDHGILAQQLNKSKKITWLDALETDFFYGREYIISLTAIPRFNCITIPKFDIKDQIPHYIGAISGGALLVVGGLLYNESEDIYLDYENLFSNGTPGTEANALYEDGMNKRKQSKTLIFAGAGILAVNAVWYGIRLAKHNKNQKLFWKNCSPDNSSFSLQPELNYNRFSTTGLDYGFSLNLQF